MRFAYELPRALTHPGFLLSSRHQGTTGSSSGVMMPKSPKLASFPEKFIVFSALCFCFSCCLLLL